MAVALIVLILVVTQAFAKVTYIFAEFTQPVTCIESPLASVAEVPSNAVETIPQEIEIISIVEQMPELIGGLNDLQASVQYPLGHHREGRVFIQFYVTETGAVENVEVARGLGPAYDAEALRVIKAARFRPGMQRGKPVRVKMSIPISFKSSQIAT